MQMLRAAGATNRARMQLTKTMWSNDYKSVARGGGTAYASIVEGLKLFGSPTRTRVLVLAVTLRDTYPRELARISGVPLVSVQRIVEDLEREGILATRLSGNQRRVILNPEWFAATELRALALRLAEVMPDIRSALDTERRRARRRGKPVDRSSHDAA